VSWNSKLEPGPISIRDEHWKTSVCVVLNGEVIVERCSSITFWLIRNARETTLQEHRRVQCRFCKSHTNFQDFYYSFTSSKKSILITGLMCLPSTISLGRRWKIFVKSKIQRVEKWGHFRKVLSEFICSYSSLIQISVFNSFDSWSNGIFLVEWLLGLVIVLC